MRKVALIDRFEKDIVVLLFDGVEGTYGIPRKTLPPECKEGDVVIVEIIAKEDDTKKRLQESSGLVERLTD